MDGENNSDNEPENIMATALPVAPLPPNVDLFAPPATGEEYLARVRHEASKNQTVVADIDLKKFLFLFFLIICLKFSNFIHIQSVQLYRRHPVYVKKGVLVLITS